MQTTRSYWHLSQQKDMGFTHQSWSFRLQKTGHPLPTQGQAAPLLYIAQSLSLPATHTHTTARPGMRGSANLLSPYPAESLSCSVSARKSPVGQSQTSAGKHETKPKALAQLLFWHKHSQCGQQFLQISLRTPTLPRHLQTSLCTTPSTYTYFFHLAFSPWNPEECIFIKNKK